MQISNQRILLVWMFFFCIKFIGFSQLTPQSLTNYKSERKYMNFIAQTNEFALVENGEFFSVLGINDVGQLHEVYTSKMPFCKTSTVKKFELNNQHILYYFGDNFIIENFNNGDMIEIKNINKPPTYIFPTVNFLHDDYYVIRYDSSYIYEIKTNKLVKILPKSFSNVKNLIHYQDENKQNIIENIKINKRITINPNARKFDLKNPFNREFDGLIFDFYNKKYIVSQNVLVDTLENVIPNIRLIDKFPMKNHVLMYGDNLNKESNFKYCIYKYDLNTNEIITIDSTIEILFGNFLNDSTFFHFKDTVYNFYNFISKENTKLNGCSGYTLNNFNSKLFLFDSGGNAPILYDLKKKKIHKFSNERINFRKFYKNNKLYLIEFNHLESTNYEFSDSIRTFHQENINSIVNEYGMRYSLLNQSKNYLYSFDDYNVIVLDTTQDLGFRRKRLFDNNYENGTLWGQKWYNYEDDLFGMVPNIKDNKIYNDLIKVNLNDFRITNISELFGWADTIGLCRYHDIIGPSNNLSNEFLILKNRLLNMKTMESFIIPDSLVVNYDRIIISIQKFYDKLIIFKADSIFEFSYPKLEIQKTVKINRVEFVEDSFYIYKLNNFEDLIYSDGKKHEIIPNSIGFTYKFSYGSIQNEKPLVFINTNTKHIKLYDVIHHSDGGIELKEKVDCDYSDPVSFDQLSSDDFVIFSIQNNTTPPTTYIVDVNTSKINIIPDISYDNIFSVDHDYILSLDNKNLKIKKFGIDGSLINSLPYPDQTDYLYSTRTVSNRLHVFARKFYLNSPYGYTNKNSRLYFDAVKFEYVFDSECLGEYFMNTYSNTTVYQDSIYYFIADIDDRGGQIYKMDLAYLTPTTHQTPSHPLTVWPNPANDILELKIEQPCDIQSVQIFDLLSKPQALFYSSCSSQLDIGYLAQGAYIIHIYQAGKKHVSKFIKM